MYGLYDSIAAPYFTVPYRVAEAVKLMDNCFHALKVGFANEFARMCWGADIDADKLFEYFYLDQRLNISSAYLKPGYAFGGPCLKKDISPLSILVVIIKPLCHC